MASPSTVKEGAKGSFQSQLQGIAVDGFQPLNCGRFSLNELIRSLNPAEKIGHGPKCFGAKEARKRIDKILRCHFPAVMEQDSLAQGKGPDATITGSFPELGNSRNRVEVRIELDQALG